MNKVRFNLSSSIFYFLLGSTSFILIFNIFFYSPILGYDALEHFQYIDFVARYLPNQLNLPDLENTKEFFNPPLAYIAPSMAQVLCRNIIESSNFLVECQPIYAKFAQVFQAILYLLTLFINFHILKKFNDSKSYINTSYLLLVSIIASNYKTISMIRGESYILFFMSLFMYFLYDSEKNNYSFRASKSVLVGIIVGLIALSRQWGFLLFLPTIVLLFSKNLTNKVGYFKFWLLSGAIGASISSWFYISLYINYGKFTAFNMNRTKFSFQNQPMNFYLPNLEQIQNIFTRPVRPYLENQFISILYSDLWGDYWGYFSFTSRYSELGRGQNNIISYLGRVNLISLISTVILISFCFITAKNYKKNLFISYINLAILFSFFGYLWFCISYPNIGGGGDNIKAVYMTQLFNLLAFSSSLHLHKLQSINKKYYNFLVILLFLIYLHNFQTYLSHFPLNFLPS